MMFNDAQDNLAACFHWPIPWCKRHTEVFPLRSTR